MTLVNAVAVIGLVTIALYALLGGADFGGGVWDLLASGPRRRTQRETIAHAIGPVWEANHVWLIFTIVLLFTCFPAAFAQIATNLNAPLSFALVGIVLRGAAFVFRNYAPPGVASQTWTAVFGTSSIVAPFFLGDTVGALVTGSYDWFSPFALSIGLFAVALTAQTAAVFLLRETDDPALRGDFRRRAVRATLAVWVAGLIPLALAYAGEPAFFAAVTSTPARIAMLVAVVAGLAVMLAVSRGLDAVARTLVGLEIVAILAGWFGAQAPWLIRGQFTYAGAAAPEATMLAFLVGAVCGGAILFPSMALLFAVFKR